MLVPLPTVTITVNVAVENDMLLSFFYQTAHGRPGIHRAGHSQKAEKVSHPGTVAAAAATITSLVGSLPQKRPLERRHLLYL